MRRGAARSRRPSAIWAKLMKRFARQIRMRPIDVSAVAEPSTTPDRTTPGGAPRGDQCEHQPRQARHRRR